MARTIKGNKNVVQSYTLTTSRYKFTAYEKRILYRIVEFAQDEIKGIMIRDHLHKIDHSLFGRELTMPVTDILKNEKDENYTKAKAAFSSLQKKTVVYEDEKVWESTQIILGVKLEKNNGMVRFEVHNKIWDAMLDFTKGYRKYELITAMQFDSVYTMRMYELLSGQKKPLEFTFEQLREMFCVTDKYKLPANFKARVLDVAKKELDKSSPYSFNYIDVKEGRKVVGFKFFPTFNPDNKDANLYETELHSKVSASTQISREAYDYFRYSFEFQAAEISKNKKTIIDGELKIPDFIGFRSSFVGPSRTAKNRIGYVINAIKKKTAESK